MIERSWKRGTQMNITQAKQQVKDTVEAYLAKDDAGFHRIPQSRQRPLFLVGAPGIGKTAIMAQIANELGIGLVSYSMTHHTRQSALGLPFITHREYAAGQFDVSEYTMSEIIASIYDYMDATGLCEGILFLDEINCVSETLYPSMLQFLQFKTFGRHHVPDNWIVVCAGNPPAYNKSVHEFDIVTLDRLRKIVVEPDYDAWRAYASDNGTHPAILSFLDVKSDSFYSVESTRTAKRFVSARGWSDLSEIMCLFEDLEKPVDLSLIEQYVQDPEIAEEFAVYYDLFRKYRSDYRVSDILAGEMPEDILHRAQEAKLDERIAFLGLLLDGLENRLGVALDRETAILGARDALKSVRERASRGTTLDEALDAETAHMREELDRRISAGTAADEWLHGAKRSLDLVKSLQARLVREGVDLHAAAFDELQREYMAEVDALSGIADDGRSALEAAFAFLEEAFGEDKEMLLFVTELTARKTHSRFIGRFGCESYYRHNEELMLDQRKDDLNARIDALE